jgi:hypothetical protein
VDETLPEQTPFDDFVKKPNALVTKYYFLCKPFLDRAMARHALYLYRPKNPASRAPIYPINRNLITTHNNNET